MKWLRTMKYQSNRELICRIDDIDYIVMRECDHTADIYLKNGHQFTVESSGLWDHLVPVNEKTTLNSLYGMAAARPLPEFDLTNEDIMSFQKDEIADHKDHINHLKNDLQDLKLENDRLKQQNKIMFEFICSVSCSRSECSICKLSRPEMLEKFGVKCAYLQGPSGLEYIRNEAFNLIKRLEDL